MPSITLYRKWRPQTFVEVVGQEHITTTLANAVRDNRIVHAYLFAGPRGTGKTTTARILAKAVSCLSDAAERPCNRCEVCLSVNDGRNLDLIEIDAASNRGIDDVRALRERIGFSPNQSRYKVYIVDEAHQLTSEAFNALLKTLEEPPAHAIFILATTEADKMPATVLSRCQRFDFRFVPFRHIRDQLARIAEAEGAQVEAGALDLFARLAGGSVRDGISLLDQMIAYGSGAVTLKQAHTILGSVAHHAVGALVKAIIAGDVSGGLGIINQAVADGADPRQFLRDMLEHLRGLLLLRGSADAVSLNLTEEDLAEMKVQAAAIPAADLLAVIRDFSQAANQLRSALQPQLPMEVAFVESALRAAAPSPKPAEPAPARTAPANAVREPAASMRTGEAKPPQAASAALLTLAQPDKASGSQDAQQDFLFLQQQWKNILAAIKSRNHNLEAVLKSGKLIAFADSNVVLGFQYEFHKKKVEEAKNKRLLEEVVSEVMHTPLIIRCEQVAGDVQRARLRPKDKREQAMEDPLIREAVDRYGARIGKIEGEDESPAES